MAYRLLADLVLVVHLGFVLFVVLGGLLVLRRPRLAWVHLPCAAWGASIEFGGWICPLTPLESYLRILAGGAGFTDTFVERYLLPILYPGALTREIQIGLGVLVVVLNLIAYGLVLRKRRERLDRASSPSEPNGGG